MYIREQEAFLRHLIIQKDCLHTLQSSLLAPKRKRLTNFTIANVEELISLLSLNRHSILNNAKDQSTPPEFL